MDAHQFDRFSRRLVSLQGTSPRRTLLQGTAALGTALAGTAVWSDPAEAKARCRKNGTKCKKKSKTCKAKHCLTTPFTIEAHWSSVDIDHDTYLFVPNEAGATLPSPLIVYTCTPPSTDCENDVYPFSCVSQDAVGPGDEVTTVRRLIPGKYEYWIELDNPSPAGDLSVTLRRPSGSVIRGWTSPANPDVSKEKGWHVFDVNGSTRSVASINQLIDEELPDGAHNPSSNVCP